MLTKNSLTVYPELHRIISRGASFIYLQPHPALKKFISNYTITFPSEDMLSEDYTVIPHGCSTLVFGCDQTGIDAVLLGPATQPVTVGDRARTFDLVFIVEFQPAGLYQFTGIPQKELADRQLPFSVVHPQLHRVIQQLLETSDNLFNFISSIDQLLLINMKNEYPQALATAAAAVLKSQGTLSIKQLANQTFYSERQLNRLANQHLGMSVKSFSRLVRVNKAVTLLENPYNSLTTIYRQTGYYDLPHFIHDFKATCALTPEEYRKKMSDFYSQIAKF